VKRLASATLPDVVQRKGTRGGDPVMDIACGSNNAFPFSTKSPSSEPKI